MSFLDGKVWFVFDLDKPFSAISAGWMTGGSFGTLELY